jgi:hypothetical protein
MKWRILLISGVLILLIFACKQEQEPALRSTINPELTENRISVKGQIQGKKFIPDDSSKLNFIVENGGYQPISIEHPGHTVFQLRIERKNTWIPPSFESSPKSPSLRTATLGPFYWGKCRNDGGGVDPDDPECPECCKGDYGLAFQWDGFEKRIDPDYRIRPPGDGDKFIAINDLTQEFSELLGSAGSVQERSTRLSELFSDDMVYLKDGVSKNQKELPGSYEETLTMNLLQYEIISENLTVVQGRLNNGTRDISELTLVWRWFEDIEQWRCVFGQEETLSN